MSKIQMQLAVVIVFATTGLLVSAVVVCDLLFGTQFVIPWRKTNYVSNPYLAATMERVHVGDPREQAVEALSDAWYHGICEYTPDFVEDVFLYGPRDPNSVTLIVLQSKGLGKEATVTEIGMPERHNVGTYFDCALPPIVFTPSP